MDHGKQEVRFNPSVTAKQRDDYLAFVHNNITFGVRVRPEIELALCSIPLSEPINEPYVEEQIQAGKLGWFIITELMDQFDMDYDEAYAVYLDNNQSLYEGICQAIRDTITPMEEDADAYREYDLEPEAFVEDELISEDELLRRLEEVIEAAGEDLPEPPEHLGIRPDPGPGWVRDRR